MPKVKQTRDPIDSFADSLHRTISLFDDDTPTNLFGRLSENWQAFHVPSGEETVTIVEAAARLGLSYETVRQFVAKNRVGVVYGPRGLQLLRWSDVSGLKKQGHGGRPRKPVVANQWIQKHREATKTPA